MTVTVASHIGGQYAYAWVGPRQAPPDPIFVNIKQLQLLVWRVFRVEAHNYLYLFLFFHNSLCGPRTNLRYGLPQVRCNKGSFQK